MKFMISNLQENGGKQTQRRSSTKPYKQDWDQMSLMPIPLMVFQGLCITAQPKVMTSDHYKNRRGTHFNFHHIIAPPITQSSIIHFQMRTMLQFFMLQIHTSSK